MLTPTTGAENWIAYRRQNPRARLRLFCFPYAGGSASLFRAWPDDVPALIDVCPIQYPGRETRLSERPYKHIMSMVQALARGLRPYLDVPFAFFGHSLGAMVCYELICQLRSEGQPEPIHLFASGCRAPNIPDPDPPIHKLPEPEFIAELRRLNGTPEPVLQNTELMQLLMPVLRADFEMVETYRYTDCGLLHCPVSAFGGLNDREVSESDLVGWRELTRGAFTLRMFPGDHFFVHTARQSIVRIVSQVLGLPHHV